MKQKCSDHEGSVREAFRCEGGGEYNALRLQMMCEGSPMNVMEVSRKPSTCLEIVGEGRLSDCEGIVRDAL